mmetsp:Transcript_15419/g.33528  ORF Transcript_15419/g.33528 Transcript_15419/m.33528 type:complete len:560 (+) Transcript_15419:491-2170(+)
MVDVFLIVAIVVAFLILAVVGFYVLVKYQHPDDKNEAWFPKLVVWTGFVIAGATVLLLPLDVANNEGYPGCDGYDTQVCGGLNMTLFWNIFFWLIPAYVFVLIPFSTFFYEADDGMLMAGTSVGANAKKKSRIWNALKWEFATLVIVTLVFFLTYYFLSDTNIPIREHQYNGTTSELFVYETPGPRYNESNASQILPFQSWELEPMGEGDRRVMESNHEFSQMGTVVVQVGLATFFAGLMAFIGWFFFALFGGVGIAAMPLDLIMNFVNRPRHMDAVEFAEAQLSIRERVNELVDIGELLKIEREQKEMANSGRGGGFLCFGGKSGGTSRKEAREEKKTLRDFKKAVYMLEKDVEDFQNCTANYNTYNVLIPIGSLIVGICAFIISIFWILHIILYILPPGNPITPFLNNYFQWFDRWFPLFGVLSVALFTFYLLLCAVKGCFKFGLRFLFFTIHPMKLNGTYMSSFLFNTGLILLCALPVVQFCTTAFATYAQYATVRQIFGTQVQYLAFFSYFWVYNVFVYAILAVALLTAIYLGCKPKDTSADGVALRDRLKSRKG